MLLGAIYEFSDQLFDAEETIQDWFAGHKIVRDTDADIDDD